MDKVLSLILRRDPLSNLHLQALTLPAVLHQVLVVDTIVQQLIVHLSLVIMLNQHIMLNQLTTHSQHQILMQVEAVQVVVIKHLIPQQQLQPLRLLRQNPFNLHIVVDQVQQWL